MFARSLLLLAASACLVSRVAACPFCTSESRTLTEELADCEYAVLATLTKPAAAQELGLNDKPQEGVPFGTIDPETGEAEFRVESLLLSNPEVPGPAAGDAIEAVFFGDPDFESLYLVRGLGDPLEWSIPLKLSPIAVAYVKKLETLPPAGADRLAFFQEYLQHEDTLLSQDAYDEFARAPYDDVKGLRDRMDREQLLAWIESPTVSPSRRRLFLTMLGVCGKPEDIPRIERLLLADSRKLTPAAEAIAALSLAAGGPLSGALTPETVRLDQRRTKLGLDAMVACYLTLRGGEGLDVIDERFLRDSEVDYSHVYSSLMAIRFLAEESDLVPRERLLESARLLLDNRDFADQVIPDLARWKDWTVLDQLVSMFKGTVAEEGEKAAFEKYIRDPVVTYLDVAVEQGGDLAERAQVALDEIEPIDPDAFRRSRSLRSFGVFAQARPKPPSSESAAVSPEAAALDAVAESKDSPGLDLPPSPAEFNSRNESVDVFEPEPPIADVPAEAEPNDPEDVIEEKATVAAAPPLLPAPAAPEPPAVWLLVGVPMLAFVGMFGLFWTVLNGRV